jgi:hypothetical protein
VVVVVLKNNWCSGEREWRGCSSRELWVLAVVWWVASSGAAGGVLGWGEVGQRVDEKKIWKRQRRKEK